MWAAWRRVTSAADVYLDTLTTEDLLVPLPHDGRTSPPAAGSQLQRITYHYWTHIGEASAVRQILGHRRLAQFVGDIESQAPYRREDVTVVPATSRPSRGDRGGGGSRARAAGRRRSARAATASPIGPSAPGSGRRPSPLTSATACARAMSPTGQTSGRPRTISR